MLKKYMLAVLVSALLLSAVPCISAAKVADYNGTLTVNNNNGNIDADLANSLTVTFEEEEEETTTNGGGGGGSGSYEFDDEDEEAEEPIENLDELLATVSSQELGFDSLAPEKMVAERLNKFLTTSKLDSSGITQWISRVSSSSAQDHLNSIANRLSSGELSALSVEHTIEVFKVKPIYTNVDDRVFRSRVTLRITASRDVSNAKVLEFIPKAAAESASQLIFSSGQPEIIEQDPVLEWSVPQLLQGQTTSFSYYIKGAVQNDDFRSIAVYDSPEPAAPTGAATQEPEQDTGQDAQQGQEDVQEREKKKHSGSSWLWPILIVVIIGGFIAGYLVYKKQMASGSQAVAKHMPGKLVIRPDLVIPYDKVRKMEQYIETQIRGGKTDVEIKQGLFSAGWDEHAVDVIMHDVHVLDNNIEKIDKYVQARINKGDTLENVRSSLISIGWRQDIVDLILDDFR